MMKKKKKKNKNKRNKKKKKKKKKEKTKKKKKKKKKKKITAILEHKKLSFSTQHDNRMNVIKVYDIKTSQIGHD